MADKENDFRTENIFWSKEDSDGGDDRLIAATGNINDTGNRRPQKYSKSVKGKRTVEVKATIPSFKKQPVMQNLSPAVAQKMATDGDKKASLKDLCLEDKQRIANLIKELARLGEEKETTIQAFEQEKATFNSQVRELLVQQDQILHDRESIQSQLHECQQLLVKYQHLVNEQKQKLSQSVPEPKMQQQRQPRTPHIADRLHPEPLSDSKSRRPFTSMIDDLIETERNQSKTTDDRELKLGPLSNPHFEHTLGNSTTDFQPLMPDRSTPQISGVNSEDDSSSSVINSHFPDLIRPKSVSTPSRKATSALIPEGLSDTEFMDYYKKLTPADRKKQLFVQKQALLEEQERLKKVLSEQEYLLEKKHVELRKQQDIQQERLNHFERTGSFPNYFAYKSDQSPNSYSIQNSSNNNGSGMNYPHTNEYYHRQPFMPIGHPAHMGGHPSHMGGHPGHMGGYYAPPSYPEVMYAMPHPHGYAPPMVPTYPGFGLRHPRQAARYEDAETASQATKETRSAGTSPRSDAVHEHHRPRPMDNHAHRSQYAPKYRQHSSKSTIESMRGDQAADLLDIVDDVESLHNKSAEYAPALSPYLVPSRREQPVPRPNARNSIPFSERSSDSYSERHIDRGVDGDERRIDRGVDVDDNSSTEDLEESQVLEDIFFIK